jgi:energy-coupling factor transporter ATP-binding protein EcfA2
MKVENRKEAFIRYPRFTALHETIRRCQRLSKKSHEPQCISLEGRSGAGKTTLVRAYEMAFPRRETEEGTAIPVFYLLTPSPVTVKGMAETMLERLGDPAAHRGNQPSLNSRLSKLIIDCEVELVILDDFHHLIDTKTNRILRTVSDWLKVLIKETQVPFLVVGIEGQVQQILRENEQLSRLFAEQETLTPFQWNAADQASIEEFTKFIVFAEKMIGAVLPTELPRAELLYRLHYATEGVIAYIMNLIRYAQEMVEEKGRSQIRMEDLSVAFEKRIRKHLINRVNPFKQTTPPEARGGNEEKELS